MKNLLPGLREFSANVFPEHQEMFETLSQGQKPHTLMITCSDSRIDPNLLTQTKPGELFVVRNAGNIVPPYGASGGGEEAAIEFAIEGLGVTNVVICGHSHCGAMAAVAGKVNLDPLPCVKKWIGHAHATKRRLDQKNGDFTLNDVVEDNILVQADNLRTHPSVSAGLRAGRIHLYGWVYNFEAGMVKIYDGKNKRFVPSVEVSADHAKDPNRFAL
ncbi:MAG: carbonic anhydrase [Proteobacteria bacterium]|nr:carbonic anhydrase [Pseudomonadota bacterium]